MTLIIGLGNPGKKYERTRHNIGRLVVSSWQSAVGLPDFKFQKKFNALISNGGFLGKKIILALPETFMNNSGTAVKSLIRNWKPSTRAKLGAGLVPHRNKVSGAGLETGNLIVIHDDLDIPLGKIRIAKNRGAAGHKGVESAIRELKTKNFVRLRMGIKPKFGKPKNPEAFVLQKFNKDEEKTVKEAIKKAAEAIEASLKDGLEKAMNTFNK